MTASRWSPQRSMRGTTCAVRAPHRDGSCPDGRPAGDRCLPLQRDDLGRDGHGGLLRGPGAQVKADRAAQSLQFGLGQPCLREPVPPVLVGAPGAHRPDVSDVGQAQRDLEQRDVELGVMGQHAEDGSRVDPPSLRLGAEIPVRPLHDDLVRAGEPGRGGEHRARVAHSDPVAEERSRTREGRREVDGAEHDHPGLWREGLDEHPQPRAWHVQVFRAARSVRAVAQHSGSAGVQQAAGIMAYETVQTLRAGAARHPVRPDEHAAAEAFRRPGDHGGHRDRPSGPYRLDHLAQLRERLGVDPLDEHVEGAAAGQPDREGVAVGHAVPLEHRPRTDERLLAQLVDGAFDTAARDAADRLASGAHQHRSSRPARGRGVGGHHGGQRRCLALGPPGHQRVHHVTHVPLLSRRPTRLCAPLTAGLL